MKRRRYVRSYGLYFLMFNILCLLLHVLRNITNTITFYGCLKKHFYVDFRTVINIEDIKFLLFMTDV